VIDWGRSARQIYDLVRAVTHPYPGAFTHWRGQQLLIWWAQVDPRAGGAAAAPGTVVGIDEGLIVQTGTGRLRALRVQLDGEDEADAGAWARRHSVAEGMQLA
jgi:methionyl-tRNA formyltransferase